MQLKTLNFVARVFHREPALGFFMVPPIEIQLCLMSHSALMYHAGLIDTWRLAAGRIFAWVIILHD